MKMKFSYLLVLIFLTSGLSAQTVISGFVKDTLNNPIPGASVYLSRTTIGTLTGKSGEFFLSVPQTGEYELTASCVGYKSASMIINSDARKQNINFRLSLNLITLGEVTVRSKDPDRQKNYSQFLKLFIGETENSERCKILNPEDIHLYRDPGNNYIKGFSVKPLLIVNKALGYTILYDLYDFNYDLKTGFLRFSGSNYFQPLQGTSRNNKKWEKNRLKAFYGSRINLLRAIASDSLPQNNFLLYEIRFDSANEFSIVKPLLVNDIRLSTLKNYSPVYYKAPVLVSYTDHHAELEGGLTGFTPRKHLSSMVFSDTIKVYPYGYFDNPYSVTWSGTMAAERIAEMIPFDFLQNSGMISSADTGSFDSKVEKYLLHDQRTNCNDQVFVQTDRNLYKPGDTIHFQAYIRDRFTGFFESNSSSLYTVLFNDKHSVTDSSRFKIENSLSPGWMIVPPEAEPGKYHLIAFTDKMQNFDPENAFQLDLSVSKKETGALRTEIKFDRESYHPDDTVVANIKISGNKGELLQSQKFQCKLLSGTYVIDSKERVTGKNGETVLSFIIPDTISGKPRIEVLTRMPGTRELVSRDFNFPFEDPFTELRFLPEGGTLIEGVEQRIGFNLTNSRGESLFITGLLKNSVGQTLDTVESGGYGPGIFTCTPQHGMYLELTGEHGKGKKWTLPDPAREGLSLSVRPVDKSSFYIEIQSGHYNGEKVYITGTMSSNLIFSREVILNKRQRIAIKTDPLPSGVVQVTLFNQDLRPVAERLYYINPDKHLKFYITTDKDYYRSGEETELLVTAVDGDGMSVKGFFSFAAIDSLSGYNPEVFVPGIEYSYNFHPFLASNLPSGALVKGLENLKNEDIDLLYMVYGWSRYTWSFNQNANLSPETDNYDVLKIKILYATKSNRADRKLDLISLEGPSVKHLITDSKGEVTIPLDSLPEITMSVTLMPNTANKQRVQGAMLSIPYNEKYFRSSRLFKLQPEIPPEAFKVTPVSYNYSLGDSVIEIPEVIIKGQARPEKVYHDIYEEKYQYAWVESLDYELLWTSFTFDDAIRRLTFAEIQPEGTYLHPKTSFFGGGKPALIILDGMPIYSGGYELVKTMSPEQMTSLTVVKNNAGFYQYGEAATGGIIFVNTRADDKNLQKYRMEWKLQHSDDRMLLPMNIYRANKEFYTPTKLEIGNDPVFRNYSTACWKPEVYLDGEKPAKIRFTNLQRTGKVRITVNGFSSNDIIGSARASYMVY
jgi:CarboxypepD_reg-like domain/MG2 domain